MAMPVEKTEAQRLTHPLTRPRVRSQPSAKKVWVLRSAIIGCLLCVWCLIQGAAVGEAKACQQQRDQLVLMQAQVQQLQAALAQRLCQLAKRGASSSNPPRLIELVLPRPATPLLGRRLDSAAVP